MSKRRLSDDDSGSNSSESSEYDSYDEGSVSDACSDESGEAIQFTGLKAHVRDGVKLLVVNDVLKCIFSSITEDVMKMRRLNSCVHQSGAFKSDKKPLFLALTEIRSMNDPGAICEISTEGGARVAYACNYATMTRYIRALDALVDARGPLREFHVGAEETKRLVASLRDYCVTRLRMQVVDDPRINDDIITVGAVSEREAELTKRADGKRRKLAKNCTLIQDAGISEDENSDEDDGGFLASDDEASESESGESRAAEIAQRTRALIEHLAGTTTAAAGGDEEDVVVGKQRAIHAQMKHVEKLKNALKSVEDHQNKWVAKRKKQIDELERAAKAAKTPAAGANIIKTRISKLQRCVVDRAEMIGLIKEDEML